jgi:hypothetical protein
MDHIQIESCDGCGTRRKVRVFHHMGTPVLTLCRCCDRKAYDALQRRVRPVSVTAKKTVKIF